jgi:glutamate 5-kinase
VVKIGTNTLCGDLGVPDPAFMADMAAQILALRAEGREVLVVSSGAIGAGRAILGFKEKPRDIKVRQACAAVGQARLMRAWEDAFAPHGVAVAQLLLTYHTFASRRSFLNLRNAVEALLDLGVVPVVNENDTVSIDEIDASFGDNDRLSALVAAKSQAGLLVILSDVAGLYTKPPGEAGAELLPVVEALTPDVRRMAGAKAGSSSGRGGMASKLEAVSTATRAGIPVVIARGRDPAVLTRLLAGESLGTRFLAPGRESGKEAWLRMAKPAGRIAVDAGAAEALRAGRHLLPAGVASVDGAFPVGSVVEIVHGGKAVAKALTALSSVELAEAKGRRSEDVRKLLRREGPFNVTRKNNLVLLDGEKTA